MKRFVFLVMMVATVMFSLSIAPCDFRVTTKEVQNGKVKRFIKWKYVKHGQEMWRYETNQMGGTHMTTVSPGDQVFAFCMKRIGWQYRTEELWCY